jgi:hypothetical protein
MNLSSQRICGVTVAFINIITSTTTTVNLSHTHTHAKITTPKFEQFPKLFRTRTSISPHLLHFSRVEISSMFINVHSSLWHLSYIHIGTQCFTYYQTLFSISSKIQTFNFEAIHPQQDELRAPGIGDTTLCVIGVQLPHGSDFKPLARPESIASPYFQKAWVEFSADNSWLPLNSYPSVGSQGFMGIRGYFMRSKLSSWC